MRQTVFDLCYSRLRAHLVLVSTWRTTHTECADRLTFNSEGDSAREGHDVMHRCQLRRVWTRLHQLKESARPIKTELGSERDYGESFAQARLRCMNSTSVTTKHHLRHAIHVQNGRGHPVIL